MELINSDSTIDGIQYASQLLREELQKPNAQKVWAKYLPEAIAQNSSPVLSYRAIARAIAAEQHHRYGIEESPSRYKDRVRRAVIGQRLTLDTLELLAETFDFPVSTRQEITKYISADELRRDSHKVENHNHFISPTSTFYNIHLDENCVVYKVDCTMVIRAVADEVSAIWARHSEDIAHIELIEGGTSEWDDDRNAWKFNLDYPLAAHESILVRYVIQVNTDVPQDGLVSLRYATTRQACFYRLLFDNPATAPETLTVTRQFASASFSPYNTETKAYTIPVYENRSSFYLDNIYKETIIFSAETSNTPAEKGDD